jgi:phage protein D
VEEFKSQKEENISQTEWALVNMVRELRGFSNKGAVPTYYAALKLATQILPSVFNEKSYMVQREHEPDVVRSYRQQAEAESRIQGVEVNPLRSFG